MAETAPTAVIAPNPPHYRRNARAFALETTFLVIGMSLMSSTSVAPSLIQQLTGSTLLVGIVTGLGSAAWLLPQLFVAGAVSRMTWRKPFMIRMCWIGQNVHVPVAIVIALLGASQPLVTLIVTLGIMAFSAFDGLRTVPFLRPVRPGHPAAPAGPRIGHRPDTGRRGQHRRGRGGAVPVG